MKVIMPPVESFDHVVRLIKLIGDPKQALDMLTALQKATVEINEAAMLHDKAKAEALAKIATAAVMEAEREKFDRSVQEHATARESLAKAVSAHKYVLATFEQRERQATEAVAVREQETEARNAAVHVDRAALEQERQALKAERDELREIRARIAGIKV